MYFFSDFTARSHSLLFDTTSFG